MRAVPRIGSILQREPCDKPFGERHFITRDPNGVLLDVIKPIPPSEELLKQYAEGATR